MKIGIVSDTHGMARRLRAAIDLLTQRGARILVHCGDIGSLACLDELVRADVQAYAVAGNMDRDGGALKRHADAVGVNFLEGAILVPLGGENLLAATHGHDERVLAALAASRKYRYLCHGHSHRQRDERINGVRLINPGAIHHPRHPHHPSAALLDSAADSLEFIEIRE